MRKLLSYVSLSRSLLGKYLLIVLSALVLLPFMFPIVSVLIYIPAWTLGDKEQSLYEDSSQLIRMWHAEAAALGGADAERIDGELRRLKDVYTKAEMFWVDADGTTRLQLPPGQPVPERWDASYTVQFMKEGVSGDIFTVVAFIGNDRSEGFMVFKVPRLEMQSEIVGLRDNYAPLYISVMLLILGLFLFVSLLFFSRIRKRLVRLQTAMTLPSDSGIPAPIALSQEDEIGRLEQAFNAMIRKLERSREREAEEEALRRDLIAKLSHDLRTPLTAIRSHAYSLGQEPLSDKGRESMALIDRKIEFVSRLIENLFSFTLLASGKYPYRPQRVDIVRMARTQLAAWYPAFEQEGFEIETDWPDRSVYWDVDPQWLERVLDNYLQNVLRHAKSGRYAALRVSAEQGGIIRIEDRGPGMTGQSEERGAGIGLSIAALMLKDMRLRGEVQTGPQGTTVRIRPEQEQGRERDGNILNET